MCELLPIFELLAHENSARFRLNDSELGSQAINGTLLPYALIGESETRTHIHKCTVYCRRYESESAPRCWQKATEIGEFTVKLPSVSTKWAWVVVWMLNLELDLPVCLRERGRSSIRLRLCECSRLNHSKSPAKSFPLLHFPFIVSQSHRVDCTRENSCISFGECGELEHCFSLVLSESINHLCAWSGAVWAFRNEKSGIGRSVSMRWYMECCAVCGLWLRCVRLEWEWLRFV